MATASYAGQPAVPTTRTDLSAEDLARVETQLAAMQEGASQAPAEPQDQEPLSVDQVREFRPTMGTRSGGAAESRENAFEIPLARVEADRPRLGL